VIRRIGFFHFGSNQKNDPIESLRTALTAVLEVDDRGSLDDCLLGLPEAFNLRSGYWDRSRKVDLSISGSLARLSTEFRIAFVVGLIEQPDTSSPLCSSAYLIDGSFLHLLSRKMGDDKSSNYSPCIDNWDQTLVHRGICLSTLICMDADFNVRKISNRHEEILSRMRTAGPRQRVLFIPACMTVYLSEAIVNAWPSDIITVLANSTSMQPSIVRLSDNLIHVKSHEKMDNVVCLTTLPSCE